MQMPSALISLSLIFFDHYLRSLSSISQQGLIKTELNEISGYGRLGLVAPVWRRGYHNRFIYFFLFFSALLIFSSSFRSAGAPSPRLIRPSRSFQYRRRQPSWIGSADSRSCYCSWVSRKSTPRHCFWPGWILTWPDSRCHRLIASAGCRHSRPRSPCEAVNETY